VLRSITWNVIIRWLLSRFHPLLFPGVSTPKTAFKKTPAFYKCSKTPAKTSLHSSEPNIPSIWWFSTAVQVDTSRQSRQIWCDGTQYTILLINQVQQSSTIDENITVSSRNIWRASGTIVQRALQPRKLDWQRVGYRRNKVLIQSDFQGRGKKRIHDDRRSCEPNLQNAIRWKMTTSIRQS
jgi:hypothetical protein